MYDDVYPTTERDRRLDDEETRRVVQLARTEIYLRYTSWARYTARCPVCGLDVEFRMDTHEALTPCNCGTPADTTI